MRSTVLIVAKPPRSKSAVKVLEGLGAQIVEVKMPKVTDVVETWLPICSSEMAAAHAANYPYRASEYGPYLREFLASGLRVTAQQLSSARKRRGRTNYPIRGIAGLSGCNGRTRGRGSRMAYFSRVASRTAARLPRCLVSRRST